MNRALFLDRDGVVNFDYGYVHKRNDIEWMPGAIDGIRLFQASGFLIIIVTNQAGIARGLFTEEHFLDFQSFFESMLRAENVHVSKTYYCPHHPEGIIPAYAMNCLCRKPNPGMLLQAQRDFVICMEESIFLGDKETDMQAARQAGVGRYFLIGSPQQNTDYEVFNSVKEVAVKYL